MRYLYYLVCELVVEILDLAVGLGEVLHRVLHQLLLLLLAPHRLVSKLQNVFVRKMFQ